MPFSICAHGLICNLDSFSFILFLHVLWLFLFNILLTAFQVSTASSQLKFSYDLSSLLSFLPSIFSPILVSHYDIPGPVLDAGHTLENKKVSLGTYCLVAVDIK